MVERKLVAMAWWRREEWAEVRALFADPERFSPNYDVWLARAEQQLMQLKMRGQPVRRVEVGLDAVRAWCARHGRNINADERAGLAAAIASGQLDG